jgi:hypothetical protein
MTRYEILTKHGKTVLDNGGITWDKIDTASCNTIGGAKDYASIQKHKFPTAEIVIRKGKTLDRVMVIR